MKYQDTWLNGKLIEKGIRICDDRYLIIKKFAEENLNNNFSLCDIGSNMAYFPIRLIEDFNAKCIAFEFHDYKKRYDIVKQQKTKNLIYLNRKISLDDLILFKGIMKFDLILALSVLHHVKESFDSWIYYLRSISRYLIIELAGEDSARINKVKDFNLPIDYEILGYGKSHLKNFNRKIILYKNEKT